MGNLFESATFVLFLGGTGLVLVIAAVAGTGNQTQSEIARAPWRSNCLSAGILLLFFSLIGWLILKGCANTVVVNPLPSSSIPIP